MTQPQIEDGTDLLPVDAASLILVDRSGYEPRILMGRRSPHLAFMPNKFVFPGGRVDLADETAASGSEMTAATLIKLQLAISSTWRPTRARALGIAAIRETREETGVILGNASHPPLAALHFFARAITPPDRPRRYDTRFFVADAAHATQTALAGDGELTEIAWVTLAEMASLDLPGITRLIGNDIAVLLTNGLVPEAEIPFYRSHQGRTERSLI